MLLCPEIAVMLRPQDVEQDVEVAAKQEGLGGGPPHLDLGTYTRLLFGAMGRVNGLAMEPTLSPGGPRWALCRRQVEDWSRGVEV